MLALRFLGARGRGRLRRRHEARYDVVVVGGGHNALVAAAYLARAGPLGRSCSSARTTSAARRCPRRRSRASTRGCRATRTSSACCRARIVDELGLRFADAAAADLLVHARAGDRRGVLVDTGDAERTRASLDGDRRRRVRRLAGVLRPRGARGARGVPDAARAARRAATSCAGASATTRPGRRCSSGRSARRSRRRSPTTCCAGSSLTDALIGTFAGAHEASLRQNRCFLYHVIGNGTGAWDVPVGGMGALTGELAALRGERRRRAARPAPR